MFDIVDWFMSFPSLCGEERTLRSTGCAVSGAPKTGDVRSCGCASRIGATVAEPVELLQLVTQGMTIGAHTMSPSDPDANPPELAARDSRLPRGLSRICNASLGASVSVGHEGSPRGGR